MAGRPLVYLDSKKMLETREYWFGVRRLEAFFFEMKIHWDNDELHKGKQGRRSTYDNLGIFAMTLLYLRRGMPYSEVGAFANLSEVRVGECIKRDLDVMTEWVVVANELRFPTLQEWKAHSSDEILDD